MQQPASSVPTGATPGVCGKTRKVVLDESDYGTAVMLLECDLRKHEVGRCRIEWTPEVLIFFDPED